MTYLDARRTIKKNNKLSEIDLRKVDPSLAKCGKNMHWRDAFFDGIVNYQAKCYKNENHCARYRFKTWVCLECGTGWIIKEEQTMGGHCVRQLWLIGLWCLAFVSVLALLIAASLWIHTCYQRKSKMRSRNGSAYSELDQSKDGYDHY